MREIPISKFKANCFNLLKQIRKTKNPIRITRFGKPLAEIVPPSPTKRKNWLGSMRGSMDITGDIVSPVIDLDDFEVMRD